MPRARGLILAGGALLMLALAGCEAETAGGGGAPALAPGVAAASADDLVIVDCLLPGRVRQLGRRMTYLEPRRPLRTDRRDCAIRGGEYVAFDRADYTTALAIWMEQARGGDAEAMTHVGEIYERGLGVAPNYAEAASWYRRAAEQGHRRAQVNLANLYAQGQGVTPDAQAALRLFGQAAGLPADALELASAEPPPPPPAPARSAADERTIQTLQTELAEARRERERLQAQVAAAAPAAPQGLERERVALEAERQELELLRSQIDARRAALAASEAELAGRAAELDGERAGIEGARAELAEAAGRPGADAAELARREAELAARATQLGQREAGLAEERRALAAERERRLAELDRELAERRATFEGELEAQAAQAGAAGAAERQREEQRLAEMQAKVAELESRLAQARPAAADGAADGPVIVLLDPELPVTRGEAVVKVRSGVTSRPITGRVESGAGVISLTVNDRGIEPDASGLFRTEVPVASGGTSVRLVAVDRQGRRAERSFTLEPGEAARETVVEADEGPTPVPASEIAGRVDFGRYHALVVGNDRYQHLEQLDMAIRDARAVAEVLRDRYGFNVTLLTNATKRDIFQAFKTLRETLTERDNLIIYYAGHGIYQDVQDLQRGYWLPVDSEEDDDYNWIPTDEVVAQVDAMSAKQVLIVADSCFSGAFMRTRSSLARLRSGRSPEAMVEWYKARTGIRTRAVMTSGGLEPVLDSGGGGHSVFARAFLDVLSENAGILEGAELYRDVAARVRYAAAAVTIGGRPFEQTPRYARLRFSGDGELADFFFVPVVN